MCTNTFSISDVAFVRKGFYDTQRFNVPLGIYFSRDASSYCNSLACSPADEQGNRYMYYTKVLVGEYTTSRDYTAHYGIMPGYSLGDPNESRFDSVVNDVRNPSVYVTLQDNQCYTEYLITFR